LSLVDGADGQLSLPVAEGRGFFPSAGGLTRCPHYRNKFPLVKEDAAASFAENHPFVTQHNGNMILIDRRAIFLPTNRGFVFA
jgi:hypothetical protein